MPLHHYIPATHLASFSRETRVQPRRNRKVYVGDLDDHRIYSTRVNKLAAEHDLYTLADPYSDPEVIEKTWQAYENRLAHAIEQLILRRLDAVAWVRVLVPFVASLLVRGPDFNKRFGQRLKNLEPIGGPELGGSANTNGARLIELQRLLGPIAVAKWTLIAANSNEILITNDRGYAPFHDQRSDEYGIAVPLDMKHVLAIVPRQSGAFVTIQDNVWCPIIEYETAPMGAIAEINRTVAAYASRNIFGPDKVLVERFSERPSASPTIEPGQYGFIDGPIARAHEFTWHRLAAALERDPSDADPWDFKLDWEQLAKGWTPPVFFPTNLIEFPPALHRTGNDICVNFYSPDGYYMLSDAIQFIDFGEPQAALAEIEKGLLLCESDILLKSRLTFVKALAVQDTGHLEEAKELYSVVLQLDPTSTAAYNNRAILYSQTSQRSQAQEDFEKALQLDPNNGLIHLNYSSYLGLGNDVSGAINELTAAIALLPDGPKRSLAHLQRGQLRSGQHQYPLAIEDLAMAVHLEPREHERAEKEVQLALAYLKAGDVDAAQKAAARATDNPDLPLAHLVLCETYLTQHRYDQVIAEATIVLRNDASDEFKGRALLLRGQAYGSQQDCEKASADFEQSVVSERDTDSRMIIAETWLKCGELTKAIDLYTSVINKQGLVAPAYNNRGIARFALNDIEGSTSDHQTARALYGESPEVGSPSRHLALCHAMANRPETAHECLSWARKYDPDSPLNDFSEGMCLLYGGAVSTALARIEPLSVAGFDPVLGLSYCLALALNDQIGRAIGLAKQYLEIAKHGYAYHSFRVHLEHIQSQDAYSAMILELREGLAIQG